MRQTTIPSASSTGAQSDENEILSDIERLLEGRPAEAAAPPTMPPRVRRVAPLVVLVGIGVALALMPFGVKDALMTGRSVAHSPVR